MVSPAAVHDDAVAGRPFLLIEVEVDSLPPPDSEINRVYYSRSMSIREATNAVRRDQSQGLSAQRLVGTPLEWAESGLEFNSPILPSEPLAIGAEELRKAIADEVDVQIVDLRGAADEVETASVSQDALRLMPHEFEEALAELSRRRWLVLVDDGYGVAKVFADLAFAQGFVLVAVLEGGYPAWVEAES